METFASEVVGLVFDDAGEAWPADPAYFARRLGLQDAPVDAVTDAVRRFGFVHVAPIRDALLVKFDPTAVCHLAAYAAFYEIAARAPRRLILACPSNVGGPDWYEIINDLATGLKRMEAALGRASNTIGRAEPQSEGFLADRRSCERPRVTFAHEKPLGETSGTYGLAVQAQADDYSKRLSKPLDAIASEDEWFGQVLSIWRDGRVGWRLPSSKSFGVLEVVNIARGRAHVVDTRATDPEGYRFRLWGSDTSYRGGHSNITLGETPVGLLRQITIEDYWQAVATGAPNYQLIHHIESSQLFSYTRLVLPLAEDGRRVNELVVLINERRLPELEMAAGPRRDT